MSTGSSFCAERVSIVCDAITPDVSLVTVAVGSRFRAGVLAADLFDGALLGLFIVIVKKSCFAVAEVFTIGVLVTLYTGGLVSNARRLVHWLTVLCDCCFGFSSLVRAYLDDCTKDWRVELSIGDAISTLSSLQGKILEIS